MAITAPPSDRTRRGVGASPARPDGRAKVVGEFAYASDLHADGVLFGATARIPHAHALVRSVDAAPALALPGVRAVLTHDDVPGAKHHGLKVADQPGLVVAAHDLLARTAQPSDVEIREALAGNVCRCTGYEKIPDAVRRASGQKGDCNG